MVSRRVSLEAEVVVVAVAEVAEEEQEVFALQSPLRVSAVEFYLFA